MLLYHASDIVRTPIFAISVKKCIKLSVLVYILYKCKLSMNATKVDKCTEICYNQKVYIIMFFIFSGSEV